MPRLYYPRGYGTRVNLEPQFEAEKEFEGAWNFVTLIGIVSITLYTVPDGMIVDHT